MPALDLISPRPLHRRAAVVAACLLAGFTAVPLLILAAVNLVPEIMPPGTYADISTEDRPLHLMYTPAMAVSIAAAIALTCALALLAAATVGSVAGPIVFLAVSGAIVMVQGTVTGTVIALGGAGDPPYELHPWGLTLAAVTCCAAVLAWSRTHAAAAPLTAQLRQGSWPGRTGPRARRRTLLTP
ncbi:hypothetical protein MF406_12920 [Georgenia sp. TF02-10]|uniref:hypothetical protein n=1 Tax=Georgenia sp. TF02-10 TaxID=2917725 RepID=UPI001FA6FCEF|nr:hypothetical protein [Georgenia sp. TF02-10]UNX53871.1 hypothetical protein MF406_12920 [Georgenia sp. TF02-10]